MASQIHSSDVSRVDLPDSARASVEALALFDGVEKIILFGSRALGDHDRRSDVDIAVSGVGIDRAMLAKIRDGIGRSRTLYKISIANLDTMPKRLRQRVLSEGLTIYEARKLRDSLANFEKAIVNLERALTIPNDRELVIEGTIHRFEITVKLMWKTLKRALEYEGLSPKTPRDSLREAFRAGWLHDETEWLDMLDHRNTTSHTYLAEELAEENYKDIVGITPAIRMTLDFLLKKYETI